MSTETYETHDDDNDRDDYSETPGKGFVSREKVRHLEQKAAKADENAQALADLQRENAMLKAGIPTDDPRAKYLKDVEPNAEALKAAALELGILEKPKEPEPDAQAAAEVQAHAQASQIAAGAPASVGNPEAAKLDQLNASVKSMPMSKLQDPSLQAQILEAARAAGAHVVDPGTLPRNPMVPLT